MGSSGVDQWKALRLEDVKLEDITACLEAERVYEEWQGKEKKDRVNSPFVAACASRAPVLGLRHHRFHVCPTRKSE